MRDDTRHKRQLYDQEMVHLLLHSLQGPQWPAQVHANARSQELHPRLPCEWQGHEHLGHLLLPRYISKKQSDLNQPSDTAGITAGGSPCCVMALAPVSSSESWSSSFPWRLRCTCFGTHQKTIHWVWVFSLAAKMPTVPHQNTSVPAPDCNFLSVHTLGDHTAQAVEFPPPSLGTRRWLLAPGFRPGPALAVAE